MTYRVSTDPQAWEKESRAVKTNYRPLPQVPGTGIYLQKGQRSGRGYG